MGKLGSAIIVGTAVGLLMGFIDTYGYAVTGYTTSELSPIIAAVLTLILFTALLKRRPTPLEHVVAVAIASGISLSTAITSGMYITYTMLGEVGDPRKLALPDWLRFIGPEVQVRSIIFYLFATAASASGIAFSLVFFKHFTEKEKLPFPVGTAASAMIKLASLLPKKQVIIPFTLGLILELAIIALNVPSVDPTPALQSVLPGSAIAISLDLFVFLLALLIPLSTSVGVGIGNLLMYLTLTPVFVASGVLVSTPFMRAEDMAVAAAPLTASTIIGFLVVITAFYMFSSRKALLATFRFIAMSNYLSKRLAVAIALMSVPVIVACLMGAVTQRLLMLAPAYIVLQFIITLVTIRVVGEAGTASQSTLPLATLALYGAGARGAMPYVLLDPYTGVPMPQFIAGASMNVMKAGKAVNVEPEVPAYWLAVALLLGAPVTFMYGHILLSVYGVNSPKLNLLRWVPVVMWMKAVYLGDVTSFSTIAVTMGAVLAVALILVLRVLRLGGISLFAVLLGLTLTPDLGLLFLLASAVKYVALRVGTDVYESLLYNASIMLAGAGAGVATSVILSLAGVV